MPQRKRAFLLSIAALASALEPVETAKVLDGKLRLSRDHEKLAEIKLTDAMRLQLIAELTDELRYPK